jgi:hypothetical protein
MTAIEPEQAAVYGLSMNKNNGIYNHGVKFAVEKKWRVEASYQCCKEDNGGLGPDLTQVAHDCNVCGCIHCDIARMYADCHLHLVLAIVHIISVDNSQFIEIRG